MADAIDLPPARAARHAEFAPEHAVYEILDKACLCHVSIMVDDVPMLVPMAYSRMGHEIILHGPVRGRLMQTLASGAATTVCVTHLDGLVLARSQFHHSMNYRCVLLTGCPRLIADPKDKLSALAHMVEHIVPGRSRQARAPSKAELAATLIVGLGLERATIKTRSGPPRDPVGDLDLDVWAGTIPIIQGVGAPVQAQGQPDTVGLSPALPDYMTKFRSI